MLHRSIDFYTDSHETVKKSSSYFHSTQHKYSPIVVDVVYDYFLIKHWEKYSKEPFSIFKENCYQLFEYESKNLPTQAQKMIFYMLDDDWFSNYSTIEGVQRTLRGIGKQTKFKNNLDNITPEFEANYSQLEQDFLHFFPELFLHCLDFLKIAK